MRLSCLILMGFFTLSCAGFARSDKSPDQIAAERALANKKTALLERENQVLRDENLELTRSGELAKADFEKKQAEFKANEAERLTQLKTTETTIKNLTEKLAILESESGGRIKQLVALNAELVEKNTKAIE